MCIFLCPSLRVCVCVRECVYLQHKCLCEVHQCVVNICLMLGVASLTFSPCLCVWRARVCVCLLVNLPHRLQMENDLRQREKQQEREREKEREREAGLEREREREREREEERGRERELDRQKERQRERQQQMVRAAESHYLAELQARRAPPEDRARPGERLTLNRLGTTHANSETHTHTHRRVHFLLKDPVSKHGSRGRSMKNKAR